jgi:hypothetical protein
MSATDDVARIIQFLNDAKLATDGTAKGHALANVHEVGGWWRC